MEKLLTRRRVADASELLEFLTELRDQGFDLTVMNVMDAKHRGDDGEYMSAGVLQTKLSDGSKVFDLLLYGD